MYDIVYLCSLLNETLVDITYYDMSVKYAIYENVAIYVARIEVSIFIS